MNPGPDTDIRWFSGFCLGFRFNKVVTASSVTKLSKVVSSLAVVASTVPLMRLHIFFAACMRHTDWILMAAATIRALFCSICCDTSQSHRCICSTSAQLLSSRSISARRTSTSCCTSPFNAHLYCSAVNDGVMMFAGIPWNAKMYCGRVMIRHWDAWQCSATDEKSLASLPRTFSRPCSSSSAREISATRKCHRCVTASRSRNSSSTSALRSAASVSCLATKVWNAWVSPPPMAALSSCSVCKICAIWYRSLTLLSSGRSSRSRCMSSADRAAASSSANTR
mmetsp:Transcript_5966/g.11087  ORF Transcript_5966/g.11087 Transcript_5966/m.11087 type:complete len:281 (+) Transcript_5966:832-1674(+)